MMQGVLELVAYDPSQEIFYIMRHFCRSFTVPFVIMEVKTQSNYNSLFMRWANWYEQRHRDLTSGPIEDVVNF